MQFRKCTSPLLKVLLWLSIGTLAHGKSLLVSTSSGNLKGHIADKGSNVTEFLGIPFAEPPIGSLRFSPPQQYRHEGVVDADKYGFDCPAFSAPPPSYPGMTPQGQDIIALFASTLGAKNRESEDCLTLNVWSKTSGQEGMFQKQQPVVVFFYGGRKSPRSWLMQRHS
jgi:cholinesterase